MLTKTFVFGLKSQAFYRKRYRVDVVSGAKKSMHSPLTQKPPSEHKANTRILEELMIKRAVIPFHAGVTSEKGAWLQFQNQYGSTAVRKSSSQDISQILKCLDDTYR
ncbi:hypothetical protein AAHE18_19G080800 [Arachis hypogaea]